MVFRPFDKQKDVLTSLTLLFLFESDLIYSYLTLTEDCTRDSVLLIKRGTHIFNLNVENQICTCVHCDGFFWHITYIGI